VDTNFGVGGTVTQDLDPFHSPSYADSSTPTAIAVRPDGTILVAGYASPVGFTQFDQVGFVAQFNSNGSLDTSFGVPGVGGGEIILADSLDRGDSALPNAVAFNEAGERETTVGSMLLQADGKILLGLSPGSENLEVRLNQNGTFDTGFGQQGVWGYGLAGIPVGQAPVIEDAAEGILAPLLPWFSPQPEFGLDRFNPDASPDLTFDSNEAGASAFNLGANWFLDDCAVQSDGNIVAVGSTYDANKQGWDMALLRLNGTNFFTQSGLQTGLTAGGTVTLQATTPSLASAAFTAVSSLDPATTPTSTVVVNLGGQTIQDTIVNVPPQVTLQIINGTFIGGSPALIVQSGQLVVLNSTFSNATAAPTILVSGGSLTLRNDVTQESTGYTEPAISVTGGTVDLGTAASPGGNTINVNGTGTWISNTTGSPVPAVGDTFEINGRVTAWPIALTVNTSSSLMLAGNSPPPLTGTVNGTPFTGSNTYTTPFGDTVTVTLGTTATAASPVGQYAIIATLSGPDAGNYVIDPATSTKGTIYVVSVGADPSSTTGAEAVTFWDNKGNAKLISAADLSSLNALNLVNQGGAAFDPNAVRQLQVWLSTPPNATTAYHLAVQLAVMDLNLLAGYVHNGDLVYAGALLPYASAYGITGLTSGGFIDLQDLMSAANAVLAQVGPGTPSGDPNQAYEAALMQVFQAANANDDFLSQELAWALVGTFA
jgi:uncharacterized delta-60 repeat protein